MSRTVIHFQRKPQSHQVSIERLFNWIRECFSDDIDVVVHVSPFVSRGFFFRLVNLVAARRSSRDRVCHITGDVHYLALSLPADRLILTIHDCAVLHRLRGWRREMIRRLWFEWPMRRAAVVTTISGATRDDLMQWVSPELQSKVRVIPNCVSSEFRFQEPVSPSGRLTFLQIGTKPHKNLDRVVAALRELPCCLHVVGALSEAQRRMLEESEIECLSLGAVSDDELLHAYRHCDCVIFASLAEGFGLPIIEAQSVGRPVITSNRSSMPEVAGDGAILVDPDDVDSIRSAARRIIEDPELRASLVVSGRENVKRFSPSVVAAQYEAIYKELTQRYGGGSAA